MNMIVNHEDFNGLVNQALKTNSRIIAEKFEKNHRDVLRAIRDLTEGNPDWGMRNFAQTPYVDPQNGQTYQMYEMTRDGYSMLVMGFTGKKAMDWKIKFLAAFNAMEERLKHNASLSGPQLMAAALIEADATMKAQAAQIEAMKPAVAAIGRLEASEGSILPRVAAKALNVMERKFFQWLHSHNWAFKQGKTWQAYSEKMKQGYLEHETITYTVEETGQERTKVQMKITAKGMARLAQLFNQEGMA